MRLALILVLFLIAISVRAQVDLFEGLIGCYNLNGTAEDSSPSGEHGIVHGAVPTTDRFGRPNSAFYFNGNSYIDISSEHLRNSSYSYSVWAKVTTNPFSGGSGIIFSIGDENDSKHQTINVSNVYANDGFVGWNVGGYNNGFPTTTSLQSFQMPILNQWYHLVITRDNAVMKMYIDGLLIAEGSTNGNEPYYGTETNAMLGMRCNFTQPLRGAIDDFVIYDRVITDEEVLELYNYGLPCVEVYVETFAECGGTQVKMEAFRADTYAWYSESGDLLYEGNPFTVNISVPTTYSVIGRIGSTDLPPVDVIVESPVVPEVTINAPEGLKEGEIGHLKALISGGGVTGLMWSINGVNLSTATTEIDYTFLNPGDYDVELTVWLANGCVTRANQVVSVEAEADLLKGLLRCYPLDGNAIDKSGNGMNGQVKGAVATESRFGYEASALVFNGKDDHVNIPVDGLKNTSFTYAAWAKSLSNPGPGGSAIIISIGDPGNSWHQTMNVSNTYSSEGLTGWNVGGYNIGSPRTTSVPSGEFPKIGEWYHMVMTRNHDVIKMYLNGKFIAQRSTNGNLPYYGSVTEATLGIRCNFTQPFHGAIDDVVIYDRPLTEAEIKILYEQGLPCEEVIVTDAARCGPGMVTLSASGAAEYHWYDIEGDLVFAGNPFEVQVVESTTYFVEGIRGDKVFPRQQVDVKFFPSPSLECSFPAAMVYQETVFSTEVTGGTPEFSFIWSVDGSVIPDETSSTITLVPSIPKDMTLAVSVVDQNGCFDECSAVVPVEGTFFIPNVITVNHDGINDSFNLFIKVGDDNFYTYEGSDSFTMKIFDRWGSLLFETKDPSAGWNGLGAPFGLYFYSIELGQLAYKGWLQIIGSG